MEKMDKKDNLNILTYKGRLNRIQFLIHFILIIGIIAIFYYSNKGNSWIIFVLYYILHLVYVKRLHDIDKSWIYTLPIIIYFILQVAILFFNSLILLGLLALLFVYFIILTIYLLFKEGMGGENKYGI